MCTKFLAGLAAAGLLFSPFVYAQDRPQKNDRNGDKKEQVSDDMARAIAFERAKDVADARQARIEKKHPSVTYANSDADRGADRDNSKADKSGEDRSKQEQRQ